MNAHRVRIHAINLAKSAYWTAEASQLGLPPGHWPLEIVLDCEDGCPPIRMRRELQQFSPSGEQAGVRYVTPGDRGKRTVLMVFND